MDAKIILLMAFGFDKLSEENQRLVAQAFHEAFLNQQTED